jgi:threonine 3-dehydrogenase
MTAMITGGAGFIGAHLALSLIDSGRKPVIYDIAHVRGPLCERSDRFIFSSGSVSTLPLLMDCIETHGVDQIFHLGGMLSLPSENNHWGAFDANIIGTYNVLEAARIKKISKVIYGSTIATYSKDIPGKTIDDRTIQRPSSFYGVTKTTGELMGRFYHRKFGIDFRAVRLPSVIGPGAKTAHMSIYNAWAIEHAIKGQPYTLECEPQTRCPVIYYKDAARSLSSLAEADPSKIKTRVYNIAGISPAFTAQKLVDTIRRSIPSAELAFRPNPLVVELLAELGSLSINDACARTEWDWQPAYTLVSAVEDFIQEYNGNSKYYI